MEQCNLCPRQCNVNRPADFTSSGTIGYCGMPQNVVVARASLHFGEEPCISGTQGAGTIFFSGCPLRCVFCQNHAISAEGYGKVVTITQLHDIMNNLISQGAHNIDLVTPTHFSKQIIEAIEMGVSVPVIYNTGGYDKLSTLQSLNGKIDVYLPDLKYDNPNLAKKYSKAEDYPKVAHKAIEEMVKQTGPVKLDENGIIQKGVIIRHMILPGHLEDTKKVIDWIAHTFSNDDVWFSLMSQYTPMPNLSSEYKELNRTITTSELTRAIDYMLDHGITKGYTQERNSATKKYIPEFDLTGII